MALKIGDVGGGGLMQNTKMRFHVECVLDSAQKTNVGRSSKCGYQLVVCGVREARKGVSRERSRFTLIQ